ncbi:CsgG/HfaB family protein [Sulfurospirillum sp. 1612]|uniref:CsgG/HfaB family protein n=1 Tax=Sulfurospirillum sp. 1612 TaxID=3094835 RepID=UPI002F95A3AB
MQKLFIIFIFSLLPLALFGKVEVTYLSIEGVGSSRADAIKDGLIEAVKQTSGVKIESKKGYLKAIKEAGSSTNGDSKHSALITEHTQKLIREATSGFIRNYSITSAEKIDNEWHVGLKIEFKQYKAPGLNPSKRRKIAIIPFEFKNSYVVLSNNVSGKEISRRFTQALITKITQARKFTVLDRENSKYYKSEKSFILSGDTNKQELLKLGKRLGADYLLIGQINNFSIENIAEHNNIGLPQAPNLTCNATISYRIIMMATQQIKWSQTISKSFTIAQNTTEAIVANASQNISSTILNNILANIYPPKVIMVTPSSIIVNEGGDNMENGEVFKAYKTGKRLTDPYTHEFLGYEEIKAGEIIITKVNPKVSYARALNGHISKGMILRRKKSEIIENQGEAKTDVTIKPNGGVVLPFD